MLFNKLNKVSTKKPTKVSTKKPIEASTKKASSKQASVGNNAPSPNWTTWKRRLTCTIREGAALSLNVVPTEIYQLGKKYPKPSFKLYQTRLKTLRSVLGQKNGIPLADHPDSSTEDPIILVRDLVKYCVSTKYRNLPDGFIKLDSDIAPISQPEIAMPLPRPHSPWLLILSAATDEFFSSDATATRKHRPKRAEVMAWIQEKCEEYREIKYSENIGAAIFTMINPHGKN